MHSTKSLEVVFDEAQRRLQLICDGDFSSGEFRDILLSALHFAEEHHIKQWLLDCSAIGSLNEEAETWLDNHLFPRIMMTMGTENYIAIVLSEKCYQALLKEAGVYGLQSYNSYIIINTFSRTDEAIAWLNGRAIPQAS